MTDLACWPTPSRRPRQVTATSLPSRPARSNSLTSSSTLAGLRIPSDHCVRLTPVFPPQNSSAIRGAGGERHIFRPSVPAEQRLSQALDRDIAVLAAAYPAGKAGIAPAAAKAAATA